MDDPELYKTKVKYILENDIEDMDLTFTEEEYSSEGHLMKVIFKSYFYAFNLLTFLQSVYDVRFLVSIPRIIIILDNYCITGCGSDT